MPRIIFLYFFFSGHINRMLRGSVQWDVTFHLQEDAGGEMWVSLPGSAELRGRGLLLATWGLLYCTARFQASPPAVLHSNQELCLVNKRGNDEQSRVRFPSCTASLQLLPPGRGVVMPTWGCCWGWGPCGGRSPRGWPGSTEGADPRCWGPVSPVPASAARLGPMARWSWWHCGSAAEGMLRGVVLSLLLSAEHLRSNGKIFKLTAPWLKVRVLKSAVILKMGV